MSDEGDLWGYLSGLVDGYEWEQGRRNGALSADESAYVTPPYERAEEFAAAVFSSAESLVARDQPDLQLEQELHRARHWPGYLLECFKRLVASNMGPEEARRFFAQMSQEEVPAPDDERSPLRPVWERLCIDVAREAISKGDEGVQRIFELYGLICHKKPSRETQRYLTRLGRCYVWGFDPECVILCRAVLDTAFREVVGDDLCEKHFGRRRSEFGLNDRIVAACKEGIIDEDTKELAHEVKVRGDKAVHYQPDVTKKVFDTIRDTLTVLEMVNGRR